MAEEMVRCPFNGLHCMPKSSLQRHILRCMVNYPDHVACPYNALHRFKTKEELRGHMLMCDSKLKSELFFENGGANEVRSEVPIHTLNVRAFNLSEENWDKE